MMASAGLSKTSVLVTGGAGFIGSHLVDELLVRARRVRVLDNFSTGLAANLEHCSDSIDLIEGDLRDPEACHRACDGCEVVFHQAALGSVPRSMKDPATTIDVNVTGTANVFAAARDAGVGRIVYASSSSVYGDSSILPKREGEEGKPLSPYALSKSMNEQLAEVFASNYGIEFVGLRYFNIYGRRQRPDGPYAAVIPRFFEACRLGEALTIYGDGEQSRDFTFVRDAVAANLLAATTSTQKRNLVSNVAAGERITVNDLARIVLEITDSDSIVEHLAPRPGDVPHSVASLAIARKSLGYTPQVDIDQGLRLTAEVVTDQS